MTGSRGGAGAGSAGSAGETGAHCQPGKTIRTYPSEIDTPCYGDLQQRLEGMGVRDLFHHVVELVLDVGMHSLGGQNGLDDLLCGLLAVIDGVPILPCVQQLGGVQVVLCESQGVRDHAFSAHTA